MSDIRIVYTVPTKTVSALSANGSHGSHHRITAARRQVRGDIARMVAADLVDHAPPVGRVAIRVTLEQRTRGRRDPDGLAGVAKPVIDGLVTGGLLVDDGWKYVESVTLRVVAAAPGVDRGTHRLVVDVTEVQA